MVKSGVVFVNGVKAKPAKSLQVGDRVKIEYLKGAKEFEVLKIPTTKTVPKSAKDEYFREIKLS
jgi:ribosomal 50S subunit-recycling heat shock protein